LGKEGGPRSGETKNRIVLTKNSTKDRPADITMLLRNYQKDAKEFQPVQGNRPAERKGTGTVNIKSSRAYQCGRGGGGSEGARKAKKKAPIGVSRRGQRGIKAKANRTKREREQEVLPKSLRTGANDRQNFGHSIDHRRRPQGGAPFGERNDVNYER